MTYRSKQCRFCKSTTQNHSRSASVLETSLSPVYLSDTMIMMMNN